MDIFLHNSNRNPNPKIETPHGCFERIVDSLLNGPDREPRLHRGLVELVKALQSNRGGAVDIIGGHNSSYNDMPLLFFS